MFTNPEDIVRQIRSEMESMLQMVLGTGLESAPSADGMERGLLRRLRDLGRLFVQLYFTHQAQLHRYTSCVGADGLTLPYHGERVKVYYSVFGKLRFARSYFYRNEQGRFPLDAALNLPAKGSSDVVREWREQLAAFTAYHKVIGTLAGILGETYSARAVEEDIRADAPLVEAYYAQAEPPEADPAATLLIVQADGKGVPMVLDQKADRKVRLGKGEKAGRKKEAVVTATYTLAPSPRTPEEVVESLFEETCALKASNPLGVQRSGPRNKRLWATLEGKTAALEFAAEQAKQQEAPHIQHRIALTDGAEALQQRMQARFPHYILVLDYIHALEYLWEAANSFWGEKSPHRTPWVRERALWMLSGRMQDLIADLRRLAETPDRPSAQKAVLEKAAGYYERNQPYMRYETYLAAGWPIATGVIEGACRHLVKDRCELSGMRWTQPGAEALLRLRCVAENGNWEAFHAYRRQQRRITYYGLAPDADTRTLEKLASSSSPAHNQCLAA